MMAHIDSIDLMIISGLTEDANVSHAELAAKCGITRQTVASRSNKLE
jgi:Lrp/AsnC family leucine-responsive transcriptional regulator